MFAHTRRVHCDKTKIRRMIARAVEFVRIAADEAVVTKARPVATREKVKVFEAILLDPKKYP